MHIHIYRVFIRCTREYKRMEHLIYPLNQVKNLFKNQREHKATCV